jgi:hypothetical protein
LDREYYSSEKSSGRKLSYSCPVSGTTADRFCTGGLRFSAFSSPHPGDFFPGCCTAFFFARWRGVWGGEHERIQRPERSRVRALSCRLQPWTVEGEDAQGAALVAAAFVRCRINNRLRQDRPARWLVLFMFVFLCSSLNYGCANQRLERLRCSFM